MGRGIASAAALLMLAGCGSFIGRVPPDNNRLVLGVTADEPRGESDAAPPVLPAAAATLAYKESQICTRGFEPLRQDVEPAQQGRAMVDWQFRCKPYDFSLLGLDFAGLVPF
jgi:hypothetical protein